MSLLRVRCPHCHTLGFLRGRLQGIWSGAKCHRCGEYARVKIWVHVWEAVLLTAALPVCFFLVLWALAAELPGWLFLPGYFLVVWLPGFLSPLVPLPPGSVEHWTTTLRRWWRRDG